MSIAFFAAASVTRPVTRNAIASSPVPIVSACFLMSRHPERSRGTWEDGRRSSRAATRPGPSSPLAPHSTRRAFERRAERRCRLAQDLDRDQQREEHVLSHEPSPLCGAAAPGGAGRRVGGPTPSTTLGTTLLLAPHERPSSPHSQQRA